MAVEIHGTTIRVPQGDTGVVKFVAEGVDLTGDERGLFTLAARNGTAIMRKILEPDAESDVFQMPFVFEDTVNLKPDTYRWSFRVVRGGAFDARGRLLAADGSHTTVAKGVLAVLAVAGGAK